jgi:hypothetical protein
MSGCCYPLPRDQPCAEFAGSGFAPAKGESRFGFHYTEIRACIAIILGLFPLSPTVTASARAGELAKGIVGKRLTYRWPRQQDIPF